MGDFSADELQRQLDMLRRARATGARSVQFGERRIEYRSDRELREAILDLERRLQGVGGRTVRLASSKGLN